VSGSYDRTIRIFKANSGRSREMYHTKRMQRIFSVQYSVDSKYVISGSDDTNIRIWKSKASESVGVEAGRDERKKLYLDAVKKRFAHMPEIKRMRTDQRAPKAIKKQRAMKHVTQMSEHRKQDNRKRHSNESAAAMQPEKNRSVIKEFE
jgi:WD repeat and SOF domain-containing protein 1